MLIGILQVATTFYNFLIK